MASKVADAVSAPSHAPVKHSQGQWQKRMKLYVGNLSFNTSESALRALFEPHGTVTSASLVMDRDTGRPRGFGFVEMSDDTQARAAMNALNGQNVDGRDLTVNEARPREGGGGGGGGSRGGFGGGGGRGGGGGGGGGGRGGW
jgi:RNA recognition motif-containing protein